MGVLLELKGMGCRHLEHVLQAMKTGWYQVSGKWYYSYSSGALAVNTTVDGYRVNSDGERV